MISDCLSPRCLCVLCLDGSHDAFVIAISVIPVKFVFWCCGHFACLAFGWCCPVCSLVSSRRGHIGRGTLGCDCRGLDLGRQHGRWTEHKVSWKRSLQGTKTETLLRKYSILQLGLFPTSPSLDSWSFKLCSDLLPLDASCTLERPCLSVRVIFLYWFFCFLACRGIEAVDALLPCLPQSVVNCWWCLLVCVVVPLHVCCCAGWVGRGNVTPCKSKSA